MQTRDSFDDYGGLTEVPPVQEPVNAAPESTLPGADVPSFVAPAPGALGSVSPESVPAALTPLAPTLPAASAPTMPAPLPAPLPVTARVTQTPHDDDREPAVPRGTFASEVPDRVAEGDERESTRAHAETVPAKPAPRTPASTQSQRIKAVRPAVRPPYLASEILREDLTPSEPGRRHMNVVLHVAPALGAAAVLTSGIDRPATWVSLAVLATLFTLTRFELSYHTLAMSVAGVGGVMLALSSGYRVAMGGGFDGPLLAAAATLLPAALLFRTWYRAAYTARVLVSLALVLAVMWATWTSNRGLLALEFDWQSWVPAVAWYVFGLLCLLSLLAFMSGETTGGCDAWALGITVWYGLYACARFALEERGVRIPNFQTLGLLEPALAAPTAVALAQLFSRIFGTAKIKS